MIFRKNITKEEAIKIAKKKLPQAIHECVIENFKKKGKAGILSFIELLSPKITELSIEGEEYFEVIFVEGDLSWQELSSDYKEVYEYLDGEIRDEKLAKCLISKKTGEFKYIGECKLGPC